MDVLTATIVSTTPAVTTTMSKNARKKLARRLTAVNTPQVSGNVDDIVSGDQVVHSVRLECSRQNVREMGIPIDTLTHSHDPLGDDNSSPTKPRLLFPGVGGVPPTDPHSSDAPPNPSELQFCATTPNVRPTAVTQPTLPIRPVPELHVDPHAVVDAVPTSAPRRSPRFSPDDGSERDAVAVTSIRSGSRQRSVASISQGDRPSFYDIDYHQQLFPSQSSQFTEPDSVDEAQFLSPRQQNIENIVAPSAMIDPVPVPCRRVCFCDNTLVPNECHACKANYFRFPCVDHVLLKCMLCPKEFHTACVARYQSRTVTEGYRCQECSTMVVGQDVPYHGISGNNTNKVRNSRLGITYSAGDMSRRRSDDYLRNKLLALLKEHASPMVVDTILGTNPRPYPSHVRIDDDRMETHVLAGRRFEVAQLLCTVDMCSCCGKVQPGNVDFRTPHAAYAPPFERKALTNVYRNGWHCTCHGFCNGSQFFSNKPNHMKVYRDNHQQKSPWEVVPGVPNLTSYNAVLCDTCWELSPHDLAFIRKFSLMNGFGPVYSPPAAVPDEAAPIAASRELHTLLTSFTSAEEMAIRQIAPFIRITKLRQGNIGMVGNTSCAHVHSRMNLILPNLPEECKVIILKYRRGVHGLASTQFRRDRIERALTLLQRTAHPAWRHITVSADRLSQWPEEGDLTTDGMGLSGVMGTPPPEDQVDEPGLRQANNDLGDLGPAPNQFVLECGVEESTTGLMCLNDDNAAHGAETAICEEAIRDRVQRIRALDGGADVDMIIRGDTVEFADQDVLPTDGFVDMNTTEWAYAKAFPTLFIPWYGPLGGSDVEGFLKEGWHITHDFRGWDTVRSKIPKFSEWTEYESWRSDGMVAKHSTVSLVMYNQKVKNQCNQQGHYVLNISGLEASTKVCEIREHPNSDEMVNHVNRLVNKAYIHTSSVPGTRKYWQKVYTKFEAVTHWHSYIHQRELTGFHTGSLAEYHDFFLRQLLCKYKNSLSGSIHADCELILTDDTAFTKAVNDYKHVCSHFLALKMELFYGHFLKPVYGISHANVTFEFAKSRGVIHYHSPQFTDAATNAPISEVMRRTQDAVVTAGEQLNSILDEHYEMVLDSFNDDCDARSAFLKLFPQVPSQLNNHKGKAYRLAFVKHVKDEAITKSWEECIAAIEDALLRCAKDLEPIMHGRYGLGAMHSGTAPHDWVKPGSNPAADHNYRPTCNEMQDNVEVVRRKEAKYPKFMREHHLYQRSSNLQNHHLTHRCSDYCAKCKKHTRPFDEVVDSGVPDEDCYTDQRGVKRVKFVKKECRFGFGEFLSFDPSGEGNLTRGKDRVDTPYVSHDNGVMRYNGLRNHGRVIQGPHANLYFGANNDTQFHLHNSSGPATLKQIGMDKYKSLLDVLSAFDLPGLEHWNATHQINRYVCGYSCKGNSNSREWIETVKDLTEEYIATPDHGEKTLRNIVGKHMNEITRREEISKDQALYSLSGGVLERTSVANVLGCSVNSISVEEFGETELEQQAGEAGAQTTTVRNSFTWANVCDRYRKRPEELHHLNLYRYVTNHWIQKNGVQVVPMFFGYPRHITTNIIPPEFMKFTLAIYKPWIKTYEEHAETEDEYWFGSYKPAFDKFLFDDEGDMPGDIRANVLRAMRKDHWDVDSSDLGPFPPGNEGTPTDERVNADNDLAREVADNDLLAAPTPITDSLGDAMDIERMIEGMDKRADNHSWNVNWDVTTANVLNEYKDKFYRKATEDILRGNLNDDHVLLHQEHLYRPEQAKTKSQKILIFHFLLCMKELFDYNDSSDKTTLLRPPDRRVLVEGLPGVGKSWIINTMRNITRLLFNCNGADVASTPTGCSAALIDGKTHFRLMSIPTGAAFKKVPSNMIESNRDRIEAARMTMSRVAAWFMDEHSMNGREMFAWLKHRAKELRRPQTVIPRESNCEEDDTLRHVQHDQVPLSSRHISLPSDVHKRPWGGIPFIYTFGDMFQLAPVGFRAFYSKVREKHVGSWLQGQIVMSDFLSPPSLDEEESSVFMLDEVVRQDDPVFLGFLMRLRSGTLQNNDLDFINSRLLENLPANEVAAFHDAIHVVPRWKMATHMTFDYLNTGFKTPIAVMHSHKQSIKSTGNCFSNSTTLPTCTAICIGAKVMLQTNFIVELKLHNGSVGTVRDICYSMKDGPYSRYSDGQEYVVVEFPESKLPVSLVPGRPKTWIPIPVHTLRCGTNCCSCTTIPLRVCNCISIHKSQGSTFGQGQIFDWAVCYLPNVTDTPVPGLEVVALSRCKRPTDMAIGNKKFEISGDKILKIGQSKAYQERNMFHHTLTSKAKATWERVSQQIQNLDPNTASKSFDGGCQHLLEWYRNRVGNGADANCTSTSSSASSCTGSLGHTNTSGLLPRSQSPSDDDWCNNSSISSDGNISSSDSTVSLDNHEDSRTLPLTDIAGTNDVIDESSFSSGRTAALANLGWWD